MTLPLNIYINIYIYDENNNIQFVSEFIVINVSYGNTLM